MVLTGAEWGQDVSFRKALFRELLFSGVLSIHLPVSGLGKSNSDKNPDVLRKVRLWPGDIHGRLDFSGSDNICTGMFLIV